MLLWGDAAHWISAIRSENANTPPGQTLKLPALPGGLRAAPLLIGVTDVMTIGALILLVIFTYGAATHARDLGIPARLHPTWGIVAWIVPVVNLWFPYWVLRDCMPPDEVRGRDLALRWWLLYVFNFLVIAIVLIARAVSPLAGGVFLVAAIGYAVLEARSGARMLDRISTVHGSLTANLVQRAWTG